MDNGIFDGIFMLPLKVNQMLLANGNFTYYFVLSVFVPFVIINQWSDIFKYSSPSICYKSFKYLVNVWKMNNI